MRGAPQCGFSATIWKINSRICLEILRPPPTRFCTLQSMAQYSLNPAWCHRTTVSDRTRKSASLSSGPSLGLGCLRFKTASCAGELGFLTSGCGGYESCKVRPRTRAERVRTWWPSYSRSDYRLRSDVVDFKIG